LSPAGDRECIRAAIENGADAVYFGLNVGFNARARAANMELADLPEILAELHGRGVKAYVTLNTLVFADELAAIEPVVQRVAEAGVDAVLVQDLGLARLVRAICPDLAIHASTQMTLTSAECIEVAKELGIQRVVLPRELSIDEIRTIRKGTDIELEAFVHGALCVAYSGQCLTSESLGGRSANRGQCAQACRLPYDVICDGEDVELGKVKYLLSPQDLAAYSLAGELIDVGVSCFKIEGRLKTPEYVANITRHYREAIDQAMAGRPVEFSDEDVREMELSFSRGFSPGWLEGNDHKRLVPGLSSSKRGVYLGEIAQVLRDRVAVRLAAPVAAGDGVVFEGDRAADDEQGGRVFHVYTKKGSRDVVDLQFGREAIDLPSLFVGQKIWKTDDPKLTAKLRKSYSSPDAVRRVAVDVSVVARAGEPLRVTATLEGRSPVVVATDDVLAVAQKRPATEEFFREQLGRLGATNYELRTLTCEIVGPPMVPLSVLSKLRHELIESLDRMMTSPPVRMVSRGSLEQLRSAVPARALGTTTASELIPLCRTMAQVEAAAGSGISAAYVDFQDLREHTAAIEFGRERGLSVWPATPRIQKPDEMGLFRRMLKDEPAGVLVRNLSALRFFRENGVACRADYSLNVTNELTAHWLMDQGAERLTVSYDLNRDQLLALVDATPPQWLEVVVHQHMPMFHMEHCVFCAVLSPGTNKTNCGRPCDDHLVQLRDRVGMEHPLKADIGCRNTLFNATAQSAAEAVPELLARGVRRLRVEFLDESPDEVRRTIELYRGLMAGDRQPPQVWSELKAMNRVGVTRGTLEERRNPLAIL
jgi:putative protease